MRIHQTKEEEQPPDENLIEMIVSGRPLHQCLPFGNTVGREDGEKTIRVLERHERAVMNMLETEPELIEKAREHFERGFNKWLLKDVKEGEEPTAKEIERAEGTYGGSIEASFREMNGRDIKPLKVAKVVKRDILPEKTQRAISENERMLKALLDGLVPRFAEAAAKVGADAAAAAVSATMGKLAAPDTKGKEAE